MRIRALMGIFLLFSLTGCPPELDVPDWDGGRVLRDGSAEDDAGDCRGGESPEETCDDGDDNDCDGDADCDDDDCEGLVCDADGSLCLNGLCG